MRVDDRIVQSYLAGKQSESYSDCWIYRAVGHGRLFAAPKPAARAWVSRLRDKLKNQIGSFVPRNVGLVKELFPDFDAVSENQTVMLVVGFPDPYDAMVLEKDGRECLGFDLVQFGADCLDETYSCQRVLTHELVHVCLHKRYPTRALSYVESLSYTAFDEGFAHALSCVEDIASFEFDEFRQRQCAEARTKLTRAMGETDPQRRSEYMRSADTGNYWQKFASIGGKLYVLKNIRRIKAVYEKGWEGFIDAITADPS